MVEHGFMFSQSRRPFAWESWTKVLTLDRPRRTGHTRTMPATLVVLNGASSAGKSSIARALQDIWPRPLVVTGIDTFIAAWPESFVSAPGADPTAGPAATGIRIAPGRGPAPSWIVDYGEDFATLMRLVHGAWASIRDGGIDQVIDHVLIDRRMRRLALEVLSGAFWVGVTCDVDELVRREALRGDRFVGFASGTSAVVHEDMVYVLVVDTTSTTSEENARLIVEAVIASR
jgi:chloramphenicol 3-O phosphotransferase